MRRVDNSDIIFVVDERIIYADDFTIKFYTVNDTDFYIAKSSIDLYEEEGKKLLKLDWADLRNIGRGVMQYKAINNVSDQQFPDMEYNESVMRTTHYYINSDLQVPPAGDGRSVMEIIDDLKDAIGDEVDRASSAEDAILQALGDYIPLLQKGQPDGVATLNGMGRVPVAQLQWPTRSSLPNLNGTDIDGGVYQVNGKRLGYEILNNKEANGVFIQYPWDSRVQVLHVGRPANDEEGEEVETYVRRYLPTPGRWSPWVNLNEGQGQYVPEYTMTHSGTSIQLRKDGVIVSQVNDDNDVYDSMDLNSAYSGTSMSAMTISPYAHSVSMNWKLRDYRETTNLVISGNFVEGLPQLEQDAFTKVRDFITSNSGMTQNVIIRIDPGTCLSLTEYVPGTEYVFTSVDAGVVRELRLSDGPSPYYTTYELPTGMSQSEANSGTSTADRLISASVLRTAIDNRVNEILNSMNLTLHANP